MQIASDTLLRWPPRKARDAANGRARWPRSSRSIARVRFKAISDEGYPGFFMPSAAFDSNGDGYIELIDENRLVRHYMGGYKATRDIEWSNYDCPC